MKPFTLQDIFKGIAFIVIVFGFGYILYLFLLWGYVQLFDIINEKTNKAVSTIFLIGFVLVSCFFSIFFIAIKGGFPIQKYYYLFRKKKWTGRN